MGSLDILQVVTPDLQAGDSTEGLPSPEAFLAGNEPYFADFVRIGDPPRLYILGVSQILSPEVEELVLGWVLVARQVNEDYMVTLEGETGLAQSLIVGGRRVATSLPAAPDWALDPQSALRVEETGQACCTMELPSTRHYVGLMPPTIPRARCWR
jgi:hypothetical protein